MLKGWIKTTFDPDGTGFRVDPYLADDQFVDPVDFMKLVEDGIIIIEKEEVE